MRPCGALLGVLLLAAAGSGDAFAAGRPTAAIARTGADTSSDPSGPGRAAPARSATGIATLPADGHRRLPRAALVVLLIGSLLALLSLMIALLALRRSRNRVAASNAELHEANASLAQSLQMRTDFLATTSHEIRTPLNGILGMTQVLLADRQLDPGLRERINAVHGAGETMRALVDDILDMAKIESGHLTLEQAPIDLRTLLAETAQLWRGQAESKNVRLDIDLSQCPDQIVSDRVRLRQILFNLLSNALKFTERGSISLTARVEAGTDGQMLALRVRDSGIGIAPEQQRLVFEKFRQADGSITRRFGGTGLGLAICRNLVETMGGTIALDSRIGEGATFTVRLPLLPVAHVQPSPQVEQNDAPVEALAHARLLIVEQNALTRRILCNMLHGFVGRIESVATIQEAGDRLVAGGIDHVVADAASGTEEATGAAPPIERLATLAATTGARMTLLFPPTRAEEAARLVAVRPEVQPIAKPIAAPALVGALDRLYARATAQSECRVPAAASAGCA